MTPETSDLFGLLFDEFVHALADKESGRAVHINNTPTQIPHPTNNTARDYADFARAYLSVNRIISYGPATGSLLVTLQDRRAVPISMRSGSRPSGPPPDTSVAVTGGSPGFYEIPPAGPPGAANVTGPQGYGKLPG